jgi:hypothetical protein
VRGLLRGRLHLQVRRPAPGLQPGQPERAREAAAD